MKLGEAKAAQEAAEARAEAAALNRPSTPPSPRGKSASKVCVQSKPVRFVLEGGGGPGHWRRLEPPVVCCFGLRV